MVQEELVKIKFLKSGTKGSDIYAALQSMNMEDLKKCSCTVTDDARAMTGSSNMGLVGLLKENEIDCITLHRIILQEALCGKVLQMSDDSLT